MVPELRVGGVLVATGSAVPLGSTQAVTATVETPFSIRDARVVWQTTPKRLTVGRVLCLPHVAGGDLREGAAAAPRAARDYRAAGLAEESSTVRGESLYIIGDLLLQPDRGIRAAWAQRWRG